MFPTDPISRYINLSFAKRSDELARVFAQQVSEEQQKYPPRSGMYFRAIMMASVQHQQSRIRAWAETVREACAEANRPVDDEVRNYMLAQIHTMCEGAKKQIAQSLALRIKQNQMGAVVGLEQSLVADADRRISAIESQITRELKLRELKEGLKSDAQARNAVEKTPPLTVPDSEHVHQTIGSSKWTRDQKIALGVGIALALIALVTIAVMIAAPEIRSRLKLDKKSGGGQQVTTSEQSHTQQALAPVSVGKDSRSRNVTKPAASPSTPTPRASAPPANTPSTSAQYQASRSPGSRVPRNAQVGFGENNPTIDSLTSDAWGVAVEKTDTTTEGIETSILVWPKASIEFPARLRIFYSSNILAKPPPEFESSTDRILHVSDWSTAENGLTFTIRNGEIDENNPMRLKVYAATQLGVPKVVCLSCK
jgi:hypothetical protein